MKTKIRDWVKIARSNNMKTCTCWQDRPLTLLKFFPHLAYFFNNNKDKLPDFSGASAESWKPINHHVCDIMINFNKSTQRIAYFHTSKV